MKIPRYADSSEFAGFSMRIDETGQSNKPTKPVASTSQYDADISEEEEVYLEEAKAYVPTTAGSDEEEYQKLKEKKEKLQKECPDPNKRSKEEKAELNRIKHRMWKISKRITPTDRMRKIESKSGHQGRGKTEEEVSLEDIIAEKEKKAGRKLNVREREYFQLKIERAKILEKPAKERSKEEIQRYKAIRNRMEKLKPDVMIDFL